CSTAAGPNCPCRPYSDHNRCRRVPDCPRVQWCTRSHRTGPPHTSSPCYTLPHVVSAWVSLQALGGGVIDSQRFASRQSRHLRYWNCTFHGSSLVSRPLGRW